MPILLVDSNEFSTSPETIKLLKDRFGEASVQYAELRHGDISVQLDTGHLLIERKRPGDLLSSIGDGRIFDQAQGMVNSARFAIILIQGYLTYNRDDKAMMDGRPTNWNGKAVRAALRAVQWCGCAVEQTPSGEFAQAVEELIRLAEKPTHFKIPDTKPVQSPIDFWGGHDEGDRKRIAIIAALPGIGTKKAESLLEWCRKDTQHLPNDHPDKAYYENELNKLGRLSEALSWATSLHCLPKEDWPQGWRPSDVVRIRQAFDLRDEEFLQCVYLRNEPVTLNDADLEQPILVTEEPKGDQRESKKKVQRKSRKATPNKSQGKLI